MMTLKTIIYDIQSGGAGSAWLEWVKTHRLRENDLWTVEPK